MTKAERKELYLTQVLSKSQGADNLDEILLEASKKFDEQNSERFD